MATLVQGSYVPSPGGVASSTDCQSALDRTELDDLIDELLRDVDEYRRLQSPRRPRSRGSSCSAAGGERSRSGSACSRSEDLRIDVDNEVDVESTQMLTSGGSSPVGFVNDVYSGSGHSASSRRGRLPSVPESIVTSPSSRVNQRISTSDSEDQMTWLEQQKVKLSSRRQEIPSLPRIQSLQHRQLMTELKSARSFLTRQRIVAEASRSPDDTETIPVRKTPQQNSSETKQQHARHEVGDRSYWSSSEVLSPESPSMSRSEKHYFVEGIERPPFTSHQTKYLFSISPPVVSPGPTQGTSSSISGFASPTNSRGQLALQQPMYFWKDCLVDASSSSSATFAATTEVKYKYSRAEGHSLTGVTDSISPVVSPKPLRLKHQSQFGAPGVSPEKIESHIIDGNTHSEIVGSRSSRESSHVTVNKTKHESSNATRTKALGSISHSSTYSNDIYVADHQTAREYRLPHDRSSNVHGIDNGKFKIFRDDSLVSGVKKNSEQSIAKSSSNFVYTSVSGQENFAVADAKSTRVKVINGACDVNVVSFPGGNQPRRNMDDSPTRYSSYQHATKPKFGVDVACQIDDFASWNQWSDMHRIVSEKESTRSRSNGSSSAARHAAYHEAASSETSESQCTDDFSATEGELLILQPIGPGLMELEHEQNQIALHHGQSNPSMHADTSVDLVDTKMSRSRSVDYAEKSYLEDKSGQKASKHRSITPVTYTRLDDWQSGRPEVYILNDVTETKRLEAVTAENSFIDSKKQPDKTTPLKSTKSHRQRKQRKSTINAQNVGPTSPNEERKVASQLTPHADSSSSSSNESKRVSKKSSTVVQTGTGLRTTLSPGSTNKQLLHSPTSAVCSSQSLLSARTPSPLRDSPSLKYSTPRFVRDSSKYWHKPRISRDEAINILKNKPAGTFVIRNSNSFPGAFGLALKVAHLPPNVHIKGHDPQADLVRHFLIEPTAKGVRLKGCSTEPVFGSLAALVYQHSLTPLSLPCKLIIPEPPPDEKDLDIHADTNNISTAQQILNQGAACHVMYVATLETESLTGPEAIQKTVNYALSLDPAPNTTVVHFKVSSEGITLTDLGHKLFFRRHYPVESVSFCGVDPDDRRWTWLNGENHLPCTARLFGFVAKKHGVTTDNACHIFGEIDSDQPAEAVVNFVMRVMLGQARRTS